MEPDDADALDEYFLVEQTHWTLDYIRSLDIEDRRTFLKVGEAVQVARNRAHTRERDRQSRRHKSR